PTSPRKRGEEQALPPRPRAESGPSPAESSPLPRLRGRVGVGAAPHSNTTCAAARRTAHRPGRGPATAGRCALFATVAHVGPGAALAWLAPAASLAGLGPVPAAPRSPTRWRSPAARPWVGGGWGRPRGGSAVAA